MKNTSPLIATPHMERDGFLGFFFFHWFLDPFYSGTPSPEKSQDSQESFRVNFLGVKA